MNTAARFWCFPDLDMYHDEATHNDNEEWEDPEQEDNTNDIDEVHKEYGVRNECILNYGQ